MEHQTETIEQEALRKLINDKITPALVSTLLQKEATQSFAMHSGYELQHRRPAIMIGDATLVYPGELLTIVALPGTGKTQVCEALAASYIISGHYPDHADDLPTTCPTFDTIGFNALYKADSKCLYIDTERPHDDNFKSYERIMRRSNADRDISLMSDGKIKALDYHCFVAFAETQLLKDELERLCEETPYGLIVIDGALDFVASMNSEEDCSGMVKWLRALAHRNGAAIAVTMHPNKGTDTMAGHLGAMLYRYSRACLLIRPDEGNEEIKILTSRFTNGKLSHGGEVSVAFTWDRETRMMLMLPDEQAPVSSKVKVNRQAIEQLFNSYIMAGRFWIPSAEAKLDYGERYNKSPKTSRNHLVFAIQNGWLETRGNGANTEYRFIENNTKNHD